MKKFNNLNLTDSEWEEVFSFPKEFNVGDLVEWEGTVWEVIKLMPEKKGTDNVYKLKELRTKQIAAFSSTYIQPLGTFVDTEVVTG